jgi:hypothetical protein
VDKELALKAQMITDGGIIRAPYIDKCYNTMFLQDVCKQM